MNSEGLLFPKEVQNLSISTALDNRDTSGTLAEWYKSASVKATRACNHFISEDHREKHHLQMNLYL